MNRAEVRAHKMRRSLSRGPRMLRVATGVALLALVAALGGCGPSDPFATDSTVGSSTSVNSPQTSSPIAASGLPQLIDLGSDSCIPQALLEKGAALGTVLAFMMAVIALSLPEMLILRKVLRPKLIAVFVGVVAVGIIIVGYLFNALDLGSMVAFK
jgi:uncharacterized protein